ncbi:MAG: hypothetical protein JXR71_07015 [Bacteroidales bacterium]|nr:hypothetical protein [Bacteroidales bacterium]
MKTEVKKLKKLLYRSFDTTLNKKEQLELQKGMEQYPELTDEKNSVASLRHRLFKQDSSFSAGFEDQLMDKIRENKAASNIFTIKPTFRAVALSGVAAIVVVLISVYFIDGSLTIDSLMGINSYNPDLGMLTFF